MQRNSAFEFGAECLGAVGLTVSWRRPLPSTETRNRFWPMVIIQQCSSSDEGAFTPASDIAISSKDGLLALRQAIDEALKYETPST